MPGASLISGEWYLHRQASSHSVEQHTRAAFCRLQMYMADFYCYSGVQRSGGAPSQLTSTYVTQMLSTGQIQDHIVHVLRPAYSSRYRVLLKAIESHLFPLGFTVPQPDRDVVGGYFVWLGLPSNMKAEELAAKCQEDENLAIAPGKIFEVPGDDVAVFERSVRLCFAWEEEWKLAEGVRRIGLVANRLLGRQDVTSEYVVVERRQEDEKNLPAST